MLYKNSQQPIHDRVSDLISRMTTEEKIAQLGAQWLILDKEGAHKDRALEMGDAHDKKPVNERYKHGLGQITRALGTVPVEPNEGVEALNALQRYLVEETRLGIPAIPHEECLVGLMVKGATLFPSSLNYGHTWNPSLIEKASEQIGLQARSVGCKQGLAPVLDVSRDVRWGRTEECLSEDPYLTGVMATSYVKGLQGKERDLYATLKHYVGHSFSEGARNHAPVNLGYKELSDTFMLPFEMAVKLANAGSVMPAYHDIDSEPCHASHHLLTQVLREQWGFDGLIVADYGGVELLKSHHAIASSVEQAAAMSLKAGLDIELPDDVTTSKVQLALDNGLLSPTDLDQTVARILKAKFELGLFENPYTSIESIELESKVAEDLAYKVAKESIVLLENDGTLPLKASTNVALIGPTADDSLALLGGYSFPIHLILSGEDSDSKVCATIRDEIRWQFNSHSYTKGCEILTERHANAPVFPGDVDMAISGNQESPLSTDCSMIAEAVTQAKQADVAIVCVGDLAGLFQTGTVGEGSDVDSIDLPGVQQQLLEAVVATGKPVVVIVTGGRPYRLGGLEEKLAGLIMGWAPGQFGARALVDTLLGNNNPSSRLTISIPKSAGAAPYFYNHKLKSAGTPIAYHFGSKYNFGYGLSYSDFDYISTSVDKTTYTMDDTILVDVTLNNCSQIDGTEVVQLYVRDKYCSQVRPVKELKGFQRVELDHGQQKTIRFELPTDMLNFTNNQGQRQVEPGEFEIMIGRSSSDIVATHTVDLQGDVRVLPKYWRMICSVSEIN
jgi:beta-glucosidase